MAGERSGDMEGEGEKDVKMRSEYFHHSCVSFLIHMWQKTSHDSTRSSHCPALNPPPLLSRLLPCRRLELIAVTIQQERERRSEQA